MDLTSRKVYETLKTVNIILGALKIVLKNQEKWQGKIGIKRKIKTMLWTTNSKIAEIVKGPEAAINPLN